MNENEIAYLYDIMHEIIDCLVPIELEEEIITTMFDGVETDEKTD